MTSSDAHRSACPINLTLEVIGDRWSLLIIRDMIFRGKRHFCELRASDEGIASNILADRLKKLVEHGVLTKADDPSHKQKAVYSLTERGIALLPILAQMSHWACQQFAVPAAQTAPVLARGPRGLAALTSTLRTTHLRGGRHRRRRRAPAR